MAYIVLPSRRRAQPRAAVGVDWSNPISSGLLVAVYPYCAIDGVKNLVNGKPLGKIGAPVVTSGAKNHENTFVHDSANSSDTATFYATLDRAVPVTTGRYTFAAITSWNEGAQAVLTGNNGGIPGPIFQTNWLDLIQVVHWNGSSNITSPTLNVPLANSVGAPVIGGFDGSNVWAQCRGKARVGTAETNNGLSMESLRIVLDWDGQGNRPNTSLLLFWDRAFNTAEANSFLENPWQVFSAATRRVYFDVVAAGGGTALYGAWAAAARQSEILGGGTH